jgi:hypothetical protein
LRDEIRVDRVAIRARLLALTQSPRQAPIHHVDLAEIPDHHVQRFEVAVDDASVVCEPNGLAHALDHAQHSCGGPMRIFLVVAIEHLFQCPPLHELHREERPA